MEYKDDNLYRVLLEAELQNRNTIENLLVDNIHSKKLFKTLKNYRVR